MMLDYIRSRSLIEALVFFSRAPVILQCVEKDPEQAIKTEFSSQSDVEYIELQHRAACESVW